MALEAISARSSDLTPVALAVIWPRSRCRWPSSAQHAATRSAIYSIRGSRRLSRRHHRDTLARVAAVRAWTGLRARRLLRSTFRSSKSEITGELRAEITASATGVKSELRAEIASSAMAIQSELRSEIAASATETRRHFDVVADRLMDKIQLVGEGVIGVDQKIDRFRSEVARRVRRVDRRLLPPRDAPARLGARYRLGAISPRSAGSRPAAERHAPAHAVHDDLLEQLEPRLSRRG